MKDEAWLSNSETLGLFHVKGTLCLMDDVLSFTTSSGALLFSSPVSRIQMRNVLSYGLQFKIDNKKTYFVSFASPLLLLFQGVFLLAYFSANLNHQSKWREALMRYGLIRQLKKLSDVDRMKLIAAPFLASLVFLVLGLIFSQQVQQSALVGVLILGPFFISLLLIPIFVIYAFFGKSAAFTSSNELSANVPPAIINRLPLSDRKRIILQGVGLLILVALFAVMIISL